jgi:hypothetical protein
MLSNISAKDGERDKKGFSSINKGTNFKYGKEWLC